MEKTLCFVCFLGILFIGCQSDDENNGPETTITSFSGTVQYENGEPVTNAELVIGSTVRGGVGNVSGDAAFLQINDGTFEVTFETEEDVVRFIIFIQFFGQQNTFIYDHSNGLLCGQEESCRLVTPGVDHDDFVIIVPCSPDDCVQLPANS